MLTVVSNFKGECTLASIYFNKADISVIGCFNELIHFSFLAQ